MSSISDEDVKNDPFDSINKMLKSYAERSERIIYIVGCVKRGSMTAEKGIEEIHRAFNETTFA